MKNFMMVIMAVVFGFGMMSCDTGSVVGGTPAIVIDVTIDTVAPGSVYTSTFEVAYTVTKSDATTSTGTETFAMTGSYGVEEIVTVTVDGESDTLPVTFEDYRMVGTFVADFDDTFDADFDGDPTNDVDCTMVLSSNGVLSITGLITSTGTWTTTGYIDTDGDGFNDSNTLSYNSVTYEITYGGNVYTK